MLESKPQYSCMGQSWSRVWPQVECWVDLDGIAAGSCQLTAFLPEGSILKGERSCAPQCTTHNAGFSCPGSCLS